MKRAVMVDSACLEIVAQQSFVALLFCGFRLTSLEGAVKK